MGSFRIAGALLLTLAAGIAQAADLTFVTEDFPPFTYAEDGKAAGPFVEVIAAVCRAVQRDCAVSVMPWRRALEMAESGEAQGIFTVLDTPQRREKFTVTPPIAQAAYAVFATDPAFAYRTPADVKGRQIVAYGPSGTSITAEEIIARSGGGGELVLESSNVNVLKKLDAGRYKDGIALVNRDVARHLIRTEAIAGVRHAGDAKDILYAIGLSKAGMSAADQAAFLDATAAVKASGAVRAIFERYGLKAAE